MRQGHSYNTRRVSISAASHQRLLMQMRPSSHVRLQRTAGDEGGQGPAGHPDGRYVPQRAPVHGDDSVHNNALPLPVLMRLPVSCCCTGPRPRSMMRRTAYCASWNFLRRGELGSPSFVCALCRRHHHLQHHPQPDALLLPPLRPHDDPPARPGRLFRPARCALTCLAVHPALGHASNACLSLHRGMQCVAARKTCLQRGALSSWY